MPSPAFRPDAEHGRAEANEMYAHGYHIDIEANIPLDQDAFPQVDNLRTCSG